MLICICGIYSKTIVTKCGIDELNRGTANYCDVGTNPVGHFFLDMLPYYLFKNDTDDTTNGLQRILGPFVYDKLEAKVTDIKERLDDTIDSLIQDLKRGALCIE